MWGNNFNIMSLILPTTYTDGQKLHHRMTDTQQYAVWCEGAGCQYCAQEAAAEAQESQETEKVTEVSEELDTDTREDFTKVTKVEEEPVEEKPIKESKSSVK